MRILKNLEAKLIFEIKKFLEKEQILILPTETVYGSEGEIIFNEFKLKWSGLSI